MRNAPKTTPTSHRRIIIIGACLFFIPLAMTGIVVFLNPRTTPAPVALRLYYATADAAQSAALDGELNTFQSLNPAVSVERVGAPEGADLLIQAGRALEGSTAYLETPVAWTGQVWVLAAQKAYLAAASARLPAEIAALRAGRASPDQFERLLADAQSTGLAPMTLGNDHRWPYLMWLEHWIAATAGPAAIASIPEPAVLAESARSKTTPIAPNTPDLYADFRPAAADLERWRSAGYFAAEAWPENWAPGLGPLNRGQAAFGLLSDFHLSAIEADRRDTLEFLPFPRRTNASGEPVDGAWSIGSAVFLAIPANAGADLGGAAKDSHLKATRRLLEFLTSPGVTGRLSKATGRPYFAWKESAGDLPAVYAAWADRSGTPAYLALAAEFSPKD